MPLAPFWSSGRKSANSFAANREPSAEAVRSSQFACENSEFAKLRKGQGGAPGAQKQMRPKGLQHKEKVAQLLC